MGEEDRFSTQNTVGSAIYGVLAFAFFVRAFRADLYLMIELILSGYWMCSIRPYLNGNGEKCGYKIHDVPGLFWTMLVLSC